MIVSDEPGGFVGWVESRSGVHSFFISFDARGRPELTSLLLDPKLRDLISLTLPHTIQRLQEAKTPSEFAKLLQELVSHSSISSIIDVDDLSLDSLAANHASVWSHVVQQIEELGWDRVESVNESFTNLVLLTWDESGRRHAIDVTIPLKYPAAAPVVAVQLPVPVHLVWESGLSSLKSVVESVDKSLKLCQDTLEVLQDFDDRTWVLEPAVPTFASCTRRIAVAKACSITIAIDPSKPREVCPVQFLGPESVTASFRNKMLSRSHMWSVTRLPRSNLENILEIAFPCKTASQTGGDGNTASLLAECGICYTSLGAQGDPKLQQHSVPPSMSSREAAIISTVQEMDLPDQLCPNPKCSRVFHRSCLVSWLHSLPSTKVSFGTLFGLCPYCQDPISVKAP